MSTNRIYEDVPNGDQIDRLENVMLRRQSRLGYVAELWASVLAEDPILAVAA